MHIETQLLKSLNLEKVVKANIKRWRDRYPPIIVERCLHSAESAVISYISTAYRSGAIVPSETLTMPKSGFGLRPVTVTDLASRLLYSALVDSIADALPAPTRGEGKWDEFRRFGVEGSHEYVVELDIASFYEFIDHKILKNELLLQFIDVGASRALEAYLQELMKKSRGIPQMLPPSDRLADAYLGTIDRKLAQAGFSTCRYVDDIRILADSWESANVAIEVATDHARELGLIASVKKSGISKRRTLAERQSVEDSFFRDNFDRTQAAMTRIKLIGDYDNIHEVEVKPAERDAALAAAWQILMDWWDPEKGKEPQMEMPTLFQRSITRCLYVLRDHPDQLDPQLLSDIVFRDGRKIEQVANYLVARTQKFPKKVRDLRPLYALARMGRQSPWFKLWLLHAIEQIAPATFTSQGSLGAWMQEQMTDRHETVRAQAAWLCATRGVLTTEKLADLYKNASVISQPALAAAAVRQGNLPNNVVKAVSEDSALNREASKWAANLLAST